MQVLQVGGEVHGGGVGVALHPHPATSGVRGVGVLLLHLHLHPEVAQGRWEQARAGEAVLPPGGASEVCQRRPRCEARVCVRLLGNGFLPFLMCFVFIWLNTA